MILYRIDGIILDTELGKKCDRENFTSKEAVHLLKQETNHNRPKLLNRGNAYKRRSNKYNN